MIVSSQDVAPDWTIVPLGRDEFIALICEQGSLLYRDLPWRNIDDAYGVLVSEIMLQQTQVGRVIRYWNRWMDLFPTIDALAAADTAVVLEAWQGLGYNRRALALKRTCETCAEQHAGELPTTVEELRALPGIGPATAGGVMAFAHNMPATYLETNVRSVFLHTLFPNRESVSDREISPYVADTCPKNVVEKLHLAGMADNKPAVQQDEASLAPSPETIARSPRAWYYAVLDYGAHLKSTTANPSRRSAHHTRQSKFEGSRREKRSFVLKHVLASPEGATLPEVLTALNDYEREAGRETVENALFDSIVTELVAEGFFRNVGGILVP